MRYLSWESVSDYLARDLEATLPLSAGSRLSVVVGPRKRYLALRIPLDKAEPDLVRSPFKELSFELRTIQNQAVLEITTATSDLFQSFCIFSAGVAELVEAEKCA